MTNKQWSKHEDDILHALLLCRFGECGCGECPYRDGKGDWNNNCDEFDCDDLLKADAAILISSLICQVKYWKRRFEETREKYDPDVAGVAMRAKEVQDLELTCSLFDGA